ELADRGVIERRDDDSSPAVDLFDERVFPFAALHFEDHRRALGEAREIAEDLDAAAAAGDRDAAQTFDGIVVELVVVEENGGLIGEEAEVGFEAVGAGAQRLFKRLQRVLRKTARTAAMAEDEKAIRRDRHLLFARDCRVSL